MEKNRPSLKSLHKTIADYMLEDVQIGDNGYETNYFSYDEGGWYIEGKFKVKGYWNEYGDGYWTPREYLCESVCGYMEELNVTYYDEDDNKIEIPKDEIDTLYTHLEKELESYCKNV